MVMQKTMIKQPVFLGIILCNFICFFTACAQKPTLMETKAKSAQTTFSWLAAYSAPEYYPVNVYSGFFGRDKEMITRIGGSGSTHRGEWGSSAATIITDPEYKAIPTHFAIDWISYAEKKTYTCTGKLDSGKILKLFQEGFDVVYKTKHATYDYIVVGMTPGGGVFVWLTGSGVSVEVGSFQGKEVPLEVGAYTPNPDNLDRTALLQQGYEDEVDPALRSLLNSNTLQIPVGLWQTYRKKYFWKPELELPAGEQATEISFRCLNGEAEVLVADGLQKNSAVARAIPKKFQLSWQSADTNYVCRPEWTAEGFGDYSILLRAFSEAFEGAGTGETGTLLMRVDAATREMRFLLKRGERETALTGFKYRIFRNVRKDKKPQ